MTHRKNRAVHHLSIGLILSSVLLFAASMVLQILAGQQSAGAQSTVFSKSSAWRAKLNRSTPLHPSSSALVASLEAQARQAGTQVSAEGAAVYEAPAFAPTASVGAWNCGRNQTGLSELWQAVPIPRDVQLGFAGRLVIYQAQTQTLWEFEGFRAAAGGGWEACAGGRIQAVADNVGAHPIPYGLTNSGTSYAAGQISSRDMANGSIQHAIGLALPQTAGSVSWPANRSQASGGSIAMGQRFRLDPTLDISSLNLTSFERMVALAAQDYGLIVWDTASNVRVTLQTGQTSGGLNGFPWAKLQALPQDYGRDGLKPGFDTYRQSATQVAPGQRVRLEWKAHNVDSCAVPAYAPSLPPTGSWDSPVLAHSTNFTLVCGGTAGSVSRSAPVSVSAQYPQVSPPVLADGITIARPAVSGLAVLLPELTESMEARPVEKVEYTVRGNLVMASFVEPFALDTTLLRDGPHVLDIRIHYADGQIETKRQTVIVANQPHELLFLPASASSPWPRIMGASSGILLAAAVMFYAVHRGWRMVRLD